MKTRILLSSLLLAGLLVFGCAPKDDTNSASGENSSVNTASNSPQQATTTAEVPAELKKDAFDYYGLSRTDPIKMKVSQNGGAAEEGTQTILLISADKDHALYTVSNTGKLAQLGEVTLKLDKEGVKITGMNGNPLPQETMELPNGLTPSKAWPFKYANLSGTNKLSGTSKVTTSVGTYTDALLVTSTAAGEQDGKKVQLTSKQWLVKGRGLVKAEMVSTQGGTKTTFVMEESK